MATEDLALGGGHNAVYGDVSWKYTRRIYIIVLNNVTQQILFKNIQKIEGSVLVTIKIYYNVLLFKIVTNKYQNKSWDLWGSALLHLDKVLQILWCLEFVMFGITITIFNV